MKRIIITIMVILVALTSGIGLSVCTIMNHIYSRNGVVVEVNEETNEVIWIDGVGYEWAIKGVEDWMIDDGITVINFDMFTQDNIKDDITIEYRYSNI